MAKAKEVLSISSVYCNLCCRVIAKKGFASLGMETIRRHRRNRESKCIFESLFLRRTLLSSQSLL